MTARFGINLAFSSHSLCLRHPAYRHVQQRCAAPPCLEGGASPHEPAPQPVRSVRTFFPFGSRTRMRAVTTLPTPSDVPRRLSALRGGQPTTGFPGCAWRARATRPHSRAHSRGTRARCSSHPTPPCHEGGASPHEPAPQPVRSVRTFFLFGSRTRMRAVTTLPTPSDVPRHLSALRGGESSSGILHMPSDSPRLCIACANHPSGAHTSSSASASEKVGVRTRLSTCSRVCVPRSSQSLLTPQWD